MPIGRSGAIRAPPYLRKSTRRLAPSASHADRQIWRAHSPRVLLFLAVPHLILLNGPPSSGKSTLAERWVLGRPVALNLDIDVIRGLLGAWDATPDGGRAALKLAIAMASTHLTDGYDVIVPQFLARESFITELETLARAVRARFVEIALIVSREETLGAFALRSVEPENQQHRDAHASLERLGGMSILGEMHDEFMQLLDTRPSAHRIDVVRGDVEATLRLLESVIDSTF